MFSGYIEFFLISNSDNIHKSRNYSLFLILYVIICSLISYLLLSFERFNAQLRNSVHRTQAVLYPIRRHEKHFFTSNTSSIKVNMYNVL